MAEAGKIKELLKPAVQSFDRMEKIRVVSHYDADGICAASIFLAACLRAGKKVHLSMVKQIRPDLIQDLNEESPQNLVFTDLGSGHLSRINELEAENILILDHHHVEGELEEGLHANPHLVGLEEGPISGAGMTYLFTKELSEANKDLAWLAVVGAIGDRQEENGEMKGPNREILKEAENLGLLKRRRGLRLFGRLSRPIHKSLEYTTRPYIPGISENESGAVQFLSDLDIKPKKEDGSWKKLSDLGEDEKKKLASEIIKERMNKGVEDAEEIFGNVYTLQNFDGKFKDARELSTALNACGRMSQAGIGVLACLEDSEAREKLDEIVKGYKKTLGELVRKVEGEEVPIQEKEEVVILDGTGEIPESFIGTVCSVLQPSISPEKILIGLAEAENEEIKVSVRVPDEVEANVGEVIGKISERFGGEGGGHRMAGGAYVKREKKDRFIESLIQALTGRKALKENG